MLIELKVTARHAKQAVGRRRVSTNQTHSAFDIRISNRIAPPECIFSWMRVHFCSKIKVIPAIPLIRNNRRDAVLLLDN